MANTMACARTRNIKNTHMIFLNEEHEQFYHAKLRAACYHDVYLEALVYVTGLTKITRSNFERIFDMKSGKIIPECIYDSWQTSETLQITRLAFNLYTDSMPTAKLVKGARQKFLEYKTYSVSDIFCSNFAFFFWQAVRIRYPECCGKQRPIEHILAEMENNALKI